MEHAATVNGYFVTKHDMPFGTGFNVYELVGDQAVKKNDRLSWFKTQEAAEEYAAGLPEPELKAPQPK